MPNAISNRAQLLIVEESAYGGGLSATALKRLRITAESIQHQSNRAPSGEIDPNRDRVQVLELSKSSAGGFDAEMSFTDFEALLRAVIGAGAGAANTPVTGTTRYVNATTLKSFYLEKQFADVNAFIGVYGGCFSELTLDITANDVVKSQWGIVAQKTTKENASRGATVTSPATDPVMRSGFDVANILLGGSAIGAAVQRLTLRINNNIRPTTQVMVGNPTAMQYGAFEVSGDMTVYFPSTALYEDMLANTARALEFTISNSAGSFRFALPAIKLTGGTPAIPGQNQDVMLDIPFIAEKGSGGSAHTLALDVTPAP
jgi:hypothetical protein